MWIYKVRSTLVLLNILNCFTCFAKYINTIFVDNKVIYNKELHFFVKTDLFIYLFPNPSSGRPQHLLLRQKTQVKWQGATYGAVPTCLLVFTKSMYYIFSKCIDIYTIVKNTFWATNFMYNTLYLAEIVNYINNIKSE
jgi:hypothetical protein